MGIFNFFRDRRNRESALAGAEMSTPPTQPPLTNEIHGLGDFGTMLSQLHQFKEAGGQFQAGGSQVFDLRSATQARNEVMEVMRQHGVDPIGGGMPKDPETMQRDIMAALQRSGIDLSAYGMPQGAPAPGELPGASSSDAPIDPDDPDSGIRNPLR